MKKILLFMSMAVAGGIEVCDGAASATMIQHVSTFSNYDPRQVGNPYFISLPNPTGSGNALVLGVSYPFAAGRTVTVSDNQTNVWTPGPVTPSNPTDGQIVSRLYYALNVAPGTQKITITFDGLLYGFQAVVTEFYNVATVAGADGSTGNFQSSAPNVEAGSLVTAAVGDLIYLYAFDMDRSDTVTGFTAGPDFTLLSADVQLGWVAEYGIQTNAGPINPTVTVASSTDPFNAVALALKSASAGTSPSSGIRIVHVCHELTRRDIQFQFPSSGNLIVCNTAFAQVQDDVTDMASVPTNNWIKAEPSEWAAQIWYAPNANTSPDLRISCNEDWFGASFVLYDITGADVSPYDSAAGTPVVSLENLDNSPLLDMPVIAPTTPNGLILVVHTTGFGPVVGTVGQELMFDSVTYGHQTDDDLMENADGYAHCYNSNTQAVAFGWLMNSSTLPESSTGVAIAFKAASGATSQGPSLTIAWLTNAGGSVVVSGRGIPQRSYTVEFTMDLRSPNWQPLSTVTSDSSGTFSYVDPPPVARGGRFYRVATY